MAGAVGDGGDGVEVEVGRGGWGGIHGGKKYSGRGPYQNAGKSSGRGWMAITVERRFPHHI